MPAQCLAHNVQSAAAAMAAAPVCVLDPGLAPGPEGEALVLVGNPNVGKSALFGALTGTYVTVSNYPGTTVEVARGWTTVEGCRRPVIDTPGTASLVPASEDERVTRDILLEGAVRAAVLVADAKNLERALALALQLSEARLPFVLCLNMMDEAVSRGIGVDVPALAQRLGVAVVPTVAVRHEGLVQLRAALEAPACGHVQVDYPPAVEAAIGEVGPLLPRAPIAARALALMALSGDETLAPWLRARLPEAALRRIDESRQRLLRAFADPLAYIVDQRRQRAAAALSRAVVRGRGSAAARGRRGERLERLTTHPVWGLPVLALVLAAAYLFVGRLGAGTLVELLEERAFGRWINPGAIALAQRWIPWAPLRDLLVGPYGAVTMALTYALALILPIVTTFFITFGFLEDSGYLPRLAVIVNRLFRKMGLNGKAVLPMVLGLGCDTMATLTTRVLETPKERLIVILLLALGVPCSAQLAVVLTLLGALSPWAMAIWAAVVGGVIVLVGRLAALLLPGTASDFVLELPPLRLPRPGNIAVKTLARLEWYLREAVPLFLLGTLLLFAADRLRLLGALQRAAAPVVQGWLGLPAEASEAFVVGFLRRDFGAAGLYRLAAEGRLDGVQVLVATVAITLFIPCVANFLMIVKERGWRTATAVAAFIVPFAVGVAAALNLVLRAMGARLT
jgi:ferrous iron transport protein B